MSDREFEKREFEKELDLDVNRTDNASSDDDLVLNEELSQKYSEVMNDIAEDIDEINADLNSKDSSGFEDLAAFESEEHGEASEDVYQFSDASSTAEIDTSEIIKKISEGYDVGGVAEDAAVLETNTDGVRDFELMTCDECRGLLYDYVSELTNPFKSRSVENHVSTCPSCKLELDDIKDMLSVMHNAETMSLPDGFKESLHSRLVGESVNVIKEYNELNPAPAWLQDKFKNAFYTAKDKTEEFIQNANWRVLAPAALSAVLVVGVTSTGIYQTMKSSDEMYDFSDESLFAAEATARPSASGLDEYIEDYESDRGSSSSPRSTSSPRSSARPYSTASPSSSMTLPGSVSSGSSSSSTTPRSSSSTTIPRSSSSSSSRSSTSSGTTTRSSSSSARATATPRPATTNRTTTSSSSTTTRRATTATPTPTPARYVTPNIILPSFPAPSETASSRQYTTPEIILPDMNEVAQAAAAAQAAEASAAEEAESAAVSGGGGGGSSQPEASADTPAVYSGGSAEETGQPETSVDAASAAQTTASPATASPSPTLSPSPGPSMTPAPIERNEEGETDSYAELSEDTLSEYYEVNAMAADAEAFEKLASSEYAKNSRLEEIVQAADNKTVQRLTICLTEDEFKEFLEYIKDNEDIISFEEDVDSIDTENGVMIIIEKPEI